MSATVCCVTGAAGYIGSWLVKKLLGRGCVVHATVRDLGDEGKTGLLRALPGAAERLRLFQANIYDAATFAPAIAGCEFVFLVAAPILQHSSGRFKDPNEAIVEATRTVLQLCERSKTVRRVIHTGSVLAAAPLRPDGGGFKDFVDESCWSPLNLPYEYGNDGLNGYVSSKVLSEREMLKFNDDSPGGGALEVVVLLCGVVGGDTALPRVPDSMHVILSPLTGVEPAHNSLKFVQALLGSVPLLHVDDACEAHVFCMECPPPLAGRLLCAAGHPSMRDVVDRYARRHPELKLRIEEVAGDGVRVEAATSKLTDMGFKYRYGAEEVLDGSVECAKRLGVL